MHQWLRIHPKMQTLWSTWIESKYNTKLRPSVDRLDDSKGYSLDNIQLMTWDENRSKGGRLKTKIVNMYDTHGYFIRQYPSGRAAARALGKKESGGISMCCRGTAQLAYGYMWQFAK